MPDFLDEKLREIRGRLGDLRPLVEEHGRLQQAARALEGMGSTDAVAKRASTGTKPPAARRPDRRSQALAVIERRPGIRTTALAQELGITPNNGYGLVKRLRAEGLVTKRADGALTARREPRSTAARNAGKPVRPKGRKPNLAGRSQKAARQSKTKKPEADPS
jgi:hypothetical protein